MANRVSMEPIVACWNDLLRLGASIHEGTALPSLLLTKLQAFPRQNLAGVPQAYGPFGQDPVHPALFAAAQPKY